MKIRFKLAKFSKKANVPSGTFEVPIPPGRGDVVKINGHVFDVVHMIHEFTIQEDGSSVLYAITLKAH